MSNPCREVITLQLGHYANFVGTHWWNLQDASLCYDISPEETPSEIFSDVLFRQGQTHSGQTTYTPRLIAFDLKGSLNTLRQEGCLYETSSESNSLAWEGAVMTHREELAQKNEFLEDLELLDGQGLPKERLQIKNRKESRVPNTVNGQLEHSRKAYNLESSVRVWSDFLRVHLHPKTISIVNQYSYEGECDRLEAFGQGESLLKENSFLDDLEDKLHFFVEECDYLQGFQVLCDIQDGFSGLGSSVTELLHDEYGGRGIFTLGLAPVSHPQSSVVKDVYHLINSVLSFVYLSNNSSSFCPLSLRGGLERRPSPHTTFPYLLYDASSWYHSSAVLSTVLDTLTLPYRLHNGGCSMGQLTDALVFSGRKVLCASASVPFPMVSDKSLPDTLVDFGETLPWRPVSACGELRENRCFAQSVCLRGISPHNMICNLAPGSKPISPLHICTSGEDVLIEYVKSQYRGTLSAVNLIQSPCKLTAPFPQIFSPSVNKDGFLQIKSRPFGSTVNNIPVLTSVQTSPLLHHTLLHLYSSVKSLDLRRFNSFLSTGTELENLHEALQDLRTMAQNYKMNFDIDISTEDDSD
ncbi:protein misato homolog 1 [Erpetoichthys calabaricus]|uniref:Protein misato homolog 1 n=1 Tax=Erpetoichthys calabaricus TaxID=27687 RepID=A0A8C4S0L0_ERPCA|nr:protein misato homolog 1 [Erpetoichthys calabaricus]